MAALERKNLMHSVARKGDLFWEVKGVARRGLVLMHTWHNTEVSRDMEIKTWKRRIADPNDEAVSVYVRREHGEWKRI
jgi:hypothetical protein